MTDRTARGRQEPTTGPPDRRRLRAHDVRPGADLGQGRGRRERADPDTGLIYILPQPSDQLHIPSWDVITAEHIAVVDADGKTVSTNGLEPTVELLTHLRIYQHRPDVHAVVHSHGRWSRVYAALRQPIPALMIDSFLYTGASRSGAPSSARSAATKSP